MAETRSLTTSYNLNNSGFKKGMDEVVNKLNEYNKALGKMTVNEEIRNLQSLVKWENISSDQRYEIRQKLYKAQQELAKAMDEEQKKRDEASLKAAEEAAGKLTERQNLALAAYNRLVNGRIEALNAESKAAQENADKQIAAIDAVMQKRRQEQEDEKRQKELDLINAKLQYHQMDEFARMGLERIKLPRKPEKCGASEVSEVVYYTYLTIRFHRSIYLLLLHKPLIFKNSCLFPKRNSLESVRMLSSA